MNTNLFYQELRSFSDFSGITNEINFECVPSDWKVIITDVKDSTKAIESGRYKDVNIVGAAAIAATQNCMNRSEFPYVFGGDGATLLIPPASIDVVLSELSSLKKLSEEKFNLQLRIGKVEVEELVKEGVIIEVAKYELTHGKCVAIFRGGGLTVAEKKVKWQPDKYEIAIPEDRKVNLGGLSCRWNNIPNKRGQILSLLVAVRSENESEIYDSILQKINLIFEGEFHVANPVNVSSMTYNSISQCVKSERRYHDSVFSISFILRFLEIIAAVLIFKFKIPPVIFNPSKYRHAMRVHSDYRKFDDMLRMVIDCSDKQIEVIREYLETLYQNGNIFYGLFESKASLMTCYVHDLDEGNHIHFIDGGNGGYAMAAKQLKAQIQEKGTD